MPGRTGRRALPTVLKALRGETRPSRLNRREPKPERKAPSCPEFLDRTAKAEWRRLVPELEMLGLATAIDRALLVAYCVQWSRLKRAEAHIATEGEVVTLPTGYRQKNPWVTIATESAKLLEKLAQNFGLSPSARAHVVANPPARDEDPFAEFLGGGKLARFMRPPGA